MHTLQSILNAQKPSDLFDLDQDVHKQYKKLVVICHPDVCKDNDAEPAFKNLNRILDLYENPSKADINQIDFFILESIVNKTKYKYKPRVTSMDETGPIYLGNSTLRLFNDNIFLDNHQKLFDLFKQKASTNNYIKYVANTDYISFNNKKGVLYKHNKDVFRLKEVIQKNPLDQVHVIWIVNRLFELAMYLEVINIVHCNISLNTVFINYQTHGIELIDWHYSHSTNQPLKFLSGQYQNIYPKEIFKNKKAISTIDLCMIKHLAIQLLGDESGVGNKLKLNKSINQNILNWFKTIETNKTLEEIYSSFRDLCKKELGPPKFYKLELNNIY